MNKYQEALDGLKFSIDFYHKQSNKILNCEDMKFKILQELINKQEKYKWHDLFKDCKDLPKSGTDVLVYRRINETKYEYAVDKNYNDGRYEAWGSDIDGYTVLKWKYIEED